MDWLKNPILKRLLASGVRAGLAALTGWLVAHGYASTDEASGLAADLTPILVGLLWSLWEASKVNERIEVALQLPKGADKVDLDAALKAKRQ
ncbi:MAG TPA: hypothetical protein VFY71_07445 [Planctomycetota bacterium]|nr:hypothetical protein [Planctomycetota bacterium]